MTSRAGLLAALLCLPAPGALAAEPDAVPAAGPKAEKPPGAVLDEITGTVKAVDRQRQAVTIETAGGPVEVHLDRNTLVYQPGGATTVLSIVPGMTARTGVDSARRAFWMQLRPPQPSAAQAPAAGPAATAAPPASPVEPPAPEGKP
jgi:outer membrane receptor protein involved in Fe transport